MLAPNTNLFALTRNAVAMEEDDEHLAALEEKAAAIAAFHDKTFRQDIDGTVLVI